MPRPFFFIVVGMLFLALLPLPYGYYTLLRIVVCAALVWAAITAFQKEHQIIPWVVVVLAIVFNPIIPIYLPKALWAVIDVGTAIFLLMGSDIFTDDPDAPNLSIKKPDDPAD